jgi:hypothetical protein
MNSNAKHMSKNIAYSLITLGIIYVLLITIGIMTQSKETGYIQDDIRILMEISTMISAILLLLFAISIDQLVEESKKLFSTFSVLMMLGLVILTLFCHFISITIGESLIENNEIFGYLVSLTWPSVIFAVDILAWDILFGLSFIALGISIINSFPKKIIPITMIVAGILSLVGLIALPLNNMNLRYIGVFGYTVMPLITSILYISGLNKENRRKNKRLTTASTL